MTAMINPKLVILNAVRSKNQAEIFRCKIARRHFLLCIVADPRTRDLFTQWRRKFSGSVTAWSGELDAAAARAGLPNRAALQHVAGAYDALPVETRLRFREYDQLITGLKEATADDRAAAVMDFIGRVLYPQPPALRWWLGYALLNYFDAQINHDVWGETTTVDIELVVGTLDQVPLELGQRPDIAKLERYVDWYYRNRVASPKVSYGELTREWKAAREAEGVFTGPKELRGIKEADDTKEARDRVKEADRLLNGLVIPPDQVEQLLRNPQTSA